MKMDPFIEAEEVAGHSVKRCCELFEVSRAAFYAVAGLNPRPATSPMPSWSTRSATCTPSPTARTGRHG